MPTNPKNDGKPRVITHSQDTFDPEPNTLIIEDRSLRYGFVHLPKVILYAKNLSASAKLLYAVLLSYAWQEEHCWPGFSRLEEDIQETEKTIRKYIRELESVGLLSHKRRGQGKTNIYTLHDLRKASLDVERTKNSQNGKIYRSATGKVPALEREEFPRNNKQSNNKQTEQDVVVISTLQKFGVSKAAARLTKGYPEDYILTKLDLAQWLIRSGSPLLDKNPAGWLRKAIEEDYVPPKGYESPEARKDRESQQAKRAQAEAKQRQAAEQEYQQLKEEARHQLREQHPAHPVNEAGLTTETAWGTVLADLQGKVPTTTYQTWFKDTVLIDVTSNLAVIGAPSPFTVQQLERHYGRIVRSLSDVLKRDVEVQFLALDSLE